MKTGKLVKYEQRLKTNLNKHMDKFKQKYPDSNYDYFGLALYDIYKQKTKLKIKKQNETRKLLTNKNDR